MKYISLLSGGPFDGLEFETVIPLSNIILTPETIGPSQVTNGVEHASVIEHRPCAYETWRTDEYEDHEVRQMLHVGERLPE